MTLNATTNNDNTGIIFSPSDMFVIAVLFGTPTINQVMDAHIEVTLTCMNLFASSTQNFSYGSIKMALEKYISSCS
jgi:hypothetical protein